ncbi:MAG: hypothetical protein HQK58_00465, partial [Deltaproteobacteria bacterium]|nr:hypothetical protein [Deltaproteobacteria bacterium]
MVILHLSLMGGQLYLWGESPIREDVPASKDSRLTNDAVQPAHRTKTKPGSGPAGRHPKTTQAWVRKTQGRIESQKGPDWSPYDAGPPALANIFGIGRGDIVIQPASICRLAAWLPTRGKVPVPSNALIGEPPDARLKLKLAPWSITAYRLEPAEAIDLVCACGDRSFLAPGVIIGSDLACWAGALRLTGSLVARQQYLPGISAIGD